MTKKLYPHKIIKVSDLLPYPNNPRTHSPEQVNQIAASIREWGFTNPVLVDEGNGIIAGHGRVDAAKKLGLESVPCIVLDGLTPAQRKAYVIADNKLALNAGWDNELLALEIEDLQSIGFDVQLLGFDDNDIKTLTITDSALDDAPDYGSGSTAGDAAAVLVNCPKCGCRFEVEQ